MKQPIERRTTATSPSRALDRASLPGQVVLVLQGGGALGSYQAGVYQALQEARIEPDWIVGTSIGAINASLIAGNAPRNRLTRLIEFWSRVRRDHEWDLRGVMPGFADKWSYWTTLTQGIPGFFTPNPLAHAGDFYPLGADHADPAATFGYVADQLDRLGIAYLHVVEPRIKGTEDVAEGQAPVAAQQLRQTFSRTLIAAGGFNGESAAAIVTAGDADLVAFGRHFIANPDLPERLRRNLPLTRYDRSTFYGGDGRGYIDYPVYAELTPATV